MLTGGIEMMASASRYVRAEGCWVRGKDECVDPISTRWLLGEPGPSAIVNESRHQPHPTARPDETIQTT